MTKDDEIVRIFEEILNEDLTLENIPLDVLERIYSYIGYYILDRDLEDLDFGD